MSHTSEPYTELESILEDALRNDDMSQAERWRKPRTTRRYLQGPLAERLLVMFREGKILYGDVQQRVTVLLDLGHLACDARLIAQGGQTRECEHDTQRDGKQLFHIRYLLSFSPPRKGTVKGL